MLNTSYIEDANKVLVGIRKLIVISILALFLHYAIIVMYFICKLLS